ncbi:MAG: polyprenyl synthetase family protein [Propionibacteriaceae bacterium]|nr:polyprenyl synthetase family protein [Propionibacteriaceae bacterium]
MTDLAQPADPAFEALVRERLDAVEGRLTTTAAAQTAFTTDAAQHLLNAGGKRFRPLLVVLASQLYPEAADASMIDRAAVVMELTHVASLYHDDVMDEAEVRRGVPSANSRWDNTVAIMVGDFLFARASSTVATMGTDYVLLQAETFARLVQGQIAETRGVQPGEDPLEHYLDVVADKTGSLIAASTVFGGMVCGAPRDVLDALAAYGEEIGVVFQLSDDLIDIASDTSGKTPGTDLREGVATLPVLMLRATAGPEDERLLDLTSRPLTDEAEVAEALAGLRAHPVLEQARAEVVRRAEVARGYLSRLPEGPAREALSALCDQVVSRSN